MQNREDLLEMELRFQGHHVKVLIEPEKWDELWEHGAVYIDETNQVRAADIKQMSQFGIKEHN